MKKRKFKDGLNLKTPYTDQVISYFGSALERNSPSLQRDAEEFEKLVSKWKKEREERSVYDTPDLILAGLVSNHVSTVLENTLNAIRDGLKTEISETLQGHVVPDTDLEEMIDTAVTKFLEGRSSQSHASPKPQK